ncbi:MAG: hypothetical protein AAF222_13185 [Pseudomonadota bacterium]
MLDAKTVDRCKAFVGRTRAITDSLSPEPADKLAVLLGRHAGKYLPLCWHWAYFNAAIPPENVGHDGHEQLGLFLPDVPLPRRMWAAGEIDVISPLRIGTPATRVTSIEDVSFKDGKSGILCFVTLFHEITQKAGSAQEPSGQHGLVRERQTIVYRQPGQPETALRAQDDPVPDGFQTIPDTTLLAYSALTQNGHRIHWDRDFCRDVESYPDLVVHGPLLATLLANHASTEPGPCRFSFRASAPVFVTSPIRIDAADQLLDAGKRAINMLRSDGVVAMTAHYQGRE